MSKEIVVRDNESELVREAIGLHDMNIAQMGAAIVGLRNLEQKHENLSGICAVLIGIVLHEAKQRLGHGKFMPFVKENFEKSHRSANGYMRLGRACLESKLESTFQFADNGRAVRLKSGKAFELLTKDLATSLRELEKFQLDLKHPIVSNVARWVNGRGSYQLMLDYPAELGGRRERKLKLTPAQLRAQNEKDAIEGYETICRSLDRFLKDNAHTLLPKDLRVLFSSALGKTKRSLDAVAD
jgi:hypothetical protein